MSTILVSMQIESVVVISGTPGLILRSKINTLSPGNGLLQYRTVVKPSGVMVNHLHSIITGSLLVTLHGISCQL